MGGQPHTAGPAALLVGRGRGVQVKTRTEIFMLCSGQVRSCRRHCSSATCGKRGPANVCVRVCQQSVPAARAKGGRADVWRDRARPFAGRGAHVDLGCWAATKLAVEQ